MMNREAAIKEKAKPGYKLTKLGWIPEEWNIVKLKDLAEIRGRVGWKGYKVEDLRLSGPLVLGAKHIGKDNKIDLSDPTYLSEEKYVESPEIMVQLNDILFVQRGSLGKVMIIEKELGDATINPSMVILRIKEKKSFLSKYIYYWLCSSNLQRIIHSEGSSTGVPMLSQAQIGSFKLLIPGNGEVEKIAQILSTWDKSIEKTEKLIEAKTLLKKGLMQQLLTGKKRFKEFIPNGGTKYTDTRLGNIPNDWEIVNLGEFTEIKGRIGWKGLKQQEYVPEGVYLVAGKHINDGKINWRLCDHITEQRYNESIEIALKKGDVIFSKDGSLGNPALIGTLPDKATINSTMMLVRPNRKLDSSYLYHIITSSFFQKLIREKKSGSSIPHIFQQDMKSFKMALPELGEQKRIASVLDMIDKNLEMLRKKLEVLKLQKQGLMQKLLTGEVRVKLN